MDVSMFLILLATLPGSLAGGDMHFVGGSLFYKFIDTTSTPYKVRITAVTGWVLGKGPCGQSCSAKDVGRETTATRGDLLNLEGETYFGNWTKEVRGKDYNSNTYATILTEVNNNITEEVVAVNIPMMWEQEVAYFDIAIDPGFAYTDILLRGKYWRWLNYTYGLDSYPAEYRLMLTIKPAPREDTQKPNNNPVAMFKPVYRIMLNKATTIRLSTMDEDGDIVRCEYAEYFDAPGLVTLNNTTINPDCSVVIDAQESAGYVDGGWGALPLKVVDIPVNVKPKLDDTNRSILSASVPQFMIQTVKTIDGPEFVDPTKESQHDFVVYVGSTLMIPLYAKPMQISTREVYGFHLRSIPLRSFAVSSPVDDPYRKGEHVKYTIGKWQPRKSDVGEYVIGALVTDTAGSEGFDRNYHLSVKDLHLLMSSNIPQSGPYFPLFPNLTEVVCKVHTTCTFPIYTNTKSAGANITSVKYTTSSIKSVTVNPPEPTTAAGMAMFVSDVSVHAVEGGEQRICFEATDSNWNTSEIMCFGVTVQLQDPCKSFPCGEGLCRSEGQSYVCFCSYWRTGAHCETDIDFCASKPCMNNGKCSSHRNLRYSCDCSGTGYFGRSCETDLVGCTLGACGPHGVCKDLDRKFECDCYSGYSGDTCNTIDANCNGVNCKNGGICIEEGGVGVCKCPLGFAGNDCQDVNVTFPVNSATTDNPFTVPSLPNGAEFQCFVDIPCMIPVYSKTSNSGTLDVHVGLHSTSLTASVTSSNRDPTTDTVKTVVSVTPNKKGVQTVCVDSGSTSPDTLCYKVNTKEHTDPPYKSLLPRFKILTPFDHSVINCIQGIPCHTVITTDLNPFTRNCTLFSGSTSAIVFKALKSEHICEIDVMFIPPATGDKEVCLQAGPQRLVQAITFQGERRCFTLKSAASDYCSPNPCTPSNGGVCLLQPGETPQFQCICPDTASGDICQYRNPCLNHPCSNGSICEGKDTSYVCKCPVGFEGKDCDAIKATKEPEFTDPSLENGATIECEVGKKCVIQMFTKGPSVELVEGPKVGDVDVKLTKPALKAGTNINEGQLVVIPNTPGDKRVCVKTKSRATQSDEVRCYHIKTKDAGEILLKIKDQFKTPTLPDGSTIKCPEKTQCHIVLHSNPDEKNICSQVKEDEVSKVDFHIFPTKLESGSCVTEVSVEPINATDLRKFCLKARGDDLPRCFEIDPDKSEPCRTTSCGPHGMCIVETDHRAGCVCDDTHRGPWCAEPAPCKSSPCDNSAVCEERGASSVCHCSIGYKDALCDTSTDVPSTSKPRFTTAMIPSGSTFMCVKDKVCKIPISIAKPDGSRPVLEVGPHDQGMTIAVPDRPSKDIDIPGRSDLYKGHVDVTPSESGDKKVCVNTGHTSSTGQSIRDDTVCYYLHVTGTEKIPTDSFQEPTPNGGSEIRCVPTDHEDCHFLVHSKPKVGECPQVEASYGKANVFPSRKDETFTDCITDISVSVGELTGSTKIICLKARSDKPERCFHVKPKPSTDPCTAKSCESGACILDKDDSPHCICYINSTGDSCCKNITVSTLSTIL